METINTIDIKEFREKGYLQEANRLFFHPLGLALAVNIDENGEETLGDVWDYRDDPEGMFFGSNELHVDKINHVADLKTSKIKKRLTSENEYGITIREDGVQVLNN